MSSEKKTPGNRSEKELAELEELQKAFLFMMARPRAGPKKYEDHKFWNTQPVPKPDEEVKDHAPIEVKTLDDVKKEPLTLPNGFQWVSLDMSNDKDVNEVYHLLTQNYVEDDGHTFRFDYSREFLKWSLTVPNYNREFHVGVRYMTAKDQPLVGFISGVPCKVRVYEQEMPMVEINFLCVHKMLRAKRLAPALIREITRRVNLTNVWQAVYTAGVVLPKPLCSNRYYHRSLNPKKLVEVGFSQQRPGMTIARMQKLYALPKEPLTPGIRPMEAKDYAAAHKLYLKQMEKCQLAHIMDEAEFGHLMGPVPNVVYSYVVEDSNGEITDFVSFYCLPSNILGHEKHKVLRAAYLYYYAHTKTPLQALIHDALIFAKNNDFDVFNALDLMENMTFLQKELFGPGDGTLQYYVYNWRCPAMETKDIGIVLH